MNIDYLYYFMDVAKTKSITRAAKLNFISPQGMSRAMNEFEKELGASFWCVSPTSWSSPKRARR